MNKFFKRVEFISTSKLLDMRSKSMFENNERAIEIFNNLHASLHKKTGLKEEDLLKFVNQDKSNLITSVVWSFGFLIDGFLPENIKIPISLSNINLSIGPSTILISLIMGISNINQVEAVQKEDGTFEIKEKLSFKKSILGSLLSFASNVFNSFNNTNLCFLSPIIYSFSVYAHMEFFGFNNIFTNKNDENKLREIIYSDIKETLVELKELGYE